MKSVKGVRGLFLYPGFTVPLNDYRKKIKKDFFVQKKILRIFFLIIRVSFIKKESPL